MRNNNSTILETYNVPEDSSKLRYVWSHELLKIEYHETQFDAPVTLELNINRFGQELTVECLVETSARCICARCIEPFDFSIREKFAFAVRLRAGAPKLADIGDDDMVSVDNNCGTVELKNRTRDEILLAIPAFPLCDEDCKGLCQSCGANLNVTTCEHCKDESNPEN
jgi:uncharacterized protein